MSGIESRTEGEPRGYVQLFVYRMQRRNGDTMMDIQNSSQTSSEGAGWLAQSPYNSPTPRRSRRSPRWPPRGSRPRRFRRTGRRRRAGPPRSRRAARRRRGPRGRRAPERGYRRGRRARSPGSAPGRTGNDAWPCQRREPPSGM